MQFDHRLIDDLARVAGGALGTLSGVREDIEARLRQQFERILAGMDLVSREDFEVARAMAQAAREEQGRLAARLEALEARLASLEGGAKPS